MRDFDLQSAMSGGKVCTRDGRHARIVSFRNGLSDIFCITASVSVGGGLYEMEYNYNKRGMRFRKLPNRNDLMMCE